MFTLQAWIHGQNGPSTGGAQRSTQEGALFSDVETSPALAFKHPAGPDLPSSSGVSKEEGDVLDSDLLSLLDVYLGSEGERVVLLDGVPCISYAGVGQEGECGVDSLARGPLCLQVRVVYGESIGPKDPNGSVNLLL